MSQIPLELHLQRHTSFATFVGRSNAAAVRHVRAVAGGERRESVWLAGPEGAGKSHLLAAGCRLADTAGARAMYLEADPDTDPKVMSMLDGIDILAIDDVHRVAGLPDWESALFRILNARLEIGGLLLAAAVHPRDCHFTLADLTSRASAAAVYRLSLLDDDDLSEAVHVHAAERGLVIDDAAVRFLLSRVSRNASELVAWLDRIDRYTLAAQRKVSIPLLRQIIADADAD